MTVVRCELLCQSSAEHLAQIYTGFGLLARQGAVQVTFRKAPSYVVGTLADPLLEVILNGTCRIVYDLRDGEKVSQEQLNRADFYFKRSYAAVSAAGLDAGGRLFPLGFNYSVYGPGDGGWRRCWWGWRSVRSAGQLRSAAVQTARCSTLLSQLLQTANGRYACQVRQFEAVPCLRSDPSILFLARLWEPQRVSHRPELIAEREHINGLRVDCVRRLRKRFGKRFVGGLAPTPYAVAHHADCLVEQARWARKKPYLQLLRRADIGIATMGLERSNGWKLAEYVAGGKAIVSEELQFTVPGSFHPGENYLEFASAEQCVQAVQRLFDDPRLRLEMMQRNHDYYHAYLRPDALVLRSLLTVLRSGALVL